MIQQPVGKFDLPPTPTIIQGPGDHNTDETHQGSAKPSQMILEKTSSGETRSRGFDLQPVIAQDEGVTDSKFQPGRDVFMGVRSPKGAALAPFPPPRFWEKACGTIIKCAAFSTGDPQFNYQ